MNLTISPEAMQWFKKELVVDQGSGIRFFGKIYGKTQVHDGFSVGMSVDKPERPIVERRVVLHDGHHEDRADEQAPADDE